MKTGAAIGQAVMNPVETVSGIPAGVGRFFQSAATNDLARHGVRGELHPITTCQYK